MEILESQQRADALGQGCQTWGPWAESGPWKDWNWLSCSWLCYFSFFFPGCSFMTASVHPHHVLPLGYLQCHCWLQPLGGRGIWAEQAPISTSPAFLKNEADFLCAERMECTVKINTVLSQVGAFACKDTVLKGVRNGRGCHFRQTSFKRVCV